VRVAVTLEQCWHRVPGGTATSILGLLDGLAATGGVDLVGVAARHGGPPEGPFRPSIEVRHLPLPRLALYEAWHGPGPLRWPAPQRATGPVDVVHATAVAVPPTRGAPLVLTVHDLAFLAEPGAFTKHGLRFFHRGTELARRHATVVVVPSEATARECRDAGFDAGRIRVVPWGHHPAPVDAATVAEVRQRFGLPERYGLFVGTAEPRKNLPRLLRAWRAAGTGVPLALAGPVGWGDDAALDALAREVGAHRLGYVEPSVRDALYAGAALVAYPSLREGFGLPVLEAMGQGAPVLTSRGTATEEVAGDAGVLVDPLDEASIADGIQEILGDPDRARALAARGRARAAAYTWAACADGYLDAYRAAVAG
jgi:glycosyltransferase involved in cell wall biosynthesis